jgi:hypothetical protein
MSSTTVDALLKTGNLNYFGHLVVARWRSGEVAFHLGAMLPDFCGMVRQPLPRGLPAKVAEGVAFHHRTDEVFHRCPAFRSLCTQSTARLQQLGLERGPARAAAHVGLELLLDGQMVADVAHCHSYLQALALPQQSAAVLGRPQDPSELLTLVERLLERGVRAEHFHPEGIAFRLERALSRRRRLALREADREPLCRWAQEATAPLASVTAEILAEIAQGLGPFPP